MHGINALRQKSHQRHVVQASTQKEANWDVPALLRIQSRIGVRF